MLFWGLGVGGTVTGDHWQVFSLKGCSLGSKTEMQSTSRSRGFTDGINKDVSWNLKARSKTALGTGYPQILLPHHFGFHLTHRGSLNLHSIITSSQRQLTLVPDFLYVCQIKFSRTNQIWLVQFSILLPAQELDSWISWVGAGKWSASRLPLDCRQGERPERRASDHP